jgi:hypothetical protein
MIGEAKEPANPRRSCQMDSDLERSGCSKHLVVHGSIADSGRLSSFRTANRSGFSVALASREVVGHLGVKLFDSLLLGPFATTSTSTSAAASLGLSSTSASTSSSGGRCLCGGCGLWLVLLVLTAHC